MLDPEFLRATTAEAPRKSVFGASAILLPFLESGEVDWQGFDGHLNRTLDANLTPAVNMDTGYANLIDEATRIQALDRTREIADGRDFIAGVYVQDEPGTAFQPDAYRHGIDEIQARAGTPIFFQSYGLVQQSDDEIEAAYQGLAKACDSFYFFELGKVFAPFGEIYSLDLYQRLMQIGNALGAKHSSLRRHDEWLRLDLRNRLRPEFKVLTGNDLAIDMIMYGSDYLLGLSTFAPGVFAIRDRYWENGDHRFFELNDLLQYLGTFAFRHPTSAYKHSAAMFLKLQKMIATDQTHPDSPGRPDSDREVLQLILDDLNKILAGAN